MDFEQYLKENRLTVKEFSQKYDLDYYCLARVKKGRFTRNQEINNNRTKLSKKKVMDMVLNQDSIGERLEREYPNYNFKEVEIRYNDWNGLFYIYARMQSKKQRIRR